MNQDLLFDSKDFENFENSKEFDNFEDYITQKLITRHANSGDCMAVCVLADWSGYRELIQLHDGSFTYENVNNFV